MTTRAAQIELLLDPLIDPDTGEIAAGYMAYFYEADTSTPKNVWTENEKTNPYTSYQLDADGMALLYGDGIYKIIVKDLNDATVFELDNLKIQANTFFARSLTGAGTATPDDDVIYCSGTFTVTIGSATYPTVADFSQPLTIKNTGVGTITVDPYSTITIDGDLTATVISGATLTIYPDGDANIWRRVFIASTDLNGTELILDADGDTSITADTDDRIDVKIGGSDELHIDGGAIYPDAAGGLNIGSLTYPFGNGFFNGSILGLALFDRDNDTGVIVDNSDDDKIHFKIFGSTELNLDGGALYPETDGGLNLGGGSNKFDNIYGNSITASTVLVSDTISEKTAAAGVTIDSVLLKDGKVASSNAVQNAAIDEDAVTPDKTDGGTLNIYSHYSTLTENSGVWTAFHTFCFYKHADLDSLSFQVRYKRNSGAGNCNVRFVVGGTATSSSLQTDSGSYAWDDTDALDISGISTGPVIVECQHQYSGGTAEVAVQGILCYNA